MPKKAIAFLKAQKHIEGAALTWYKATPFCSEEAAHEFDIFSVYRKKCNDFEFGNDYQEFFCDIKPEEAELIYKGSLKCSNNRKYNFVDKGAQTGSVYVYFVSSETMPAVGPAPVKIRDLEIWWSHERLEKRIDLFRNKYKDKVKSSVCGRTVEGREIFSLQVGKGKPCLGLLGAVHAGEAGPELILSALEKFTEENPGLLENNSIVTIPSLNIDMRERLVSGNPWYLRVNAAGVDLNRNFPTDWGTVAKGYGFSSDDRGGMTFRGVTPASEPETKAAIDFFKKNTPKCIFSFHALAGICGLPALAAGGVGKTNKKFYEQSEFYAAKYARGLYPDCPPDASYLSYGGTAGSFARWCWHELEIPGFDLELSAQTASKALEKSQKDKIDRPLLREYAERHANAIKAVIAAQSETF